MFRRFWRFCKKWFLKLKRMEGTPHSIARGVGIGLFIGAVVPIGFQTPVVLLAAFLCRANKLLAFLATCYTNPYTAPIIYPIFCILGAKILGVSLSLRKIQLDFREFIAAPSWGTLSGMSRELVECFFVGSFAIGIVLSVISYWLTYRLVVRHREHAALKKKLAKAKRAELTATLSENTVNRGAA